MYRALLLVVLLTVGCAPHQPLVAVGVACDSYASSLRVVAGMNERGRLSPSQVRAVDQVVAMVSPICSNPSSPTAVEALDKVEEGVKALLRVRGDVDANS